MLLGFSSKVLQSSQSRNLEAFLAGNSPWAWQELEKLQRNIVKFDQHPEDEPLQLEFIKKLFKILKKNLTKAELPTLTELRVLSLVHVPGLPVQTLRIHRQKWTVQSKISIKKKKRKRRHSVHSSLRPLTSMRSCLTGSTSWRSANDSRSPIWSIQARKSWARRCLRWLAPAPPAPVCKHNRVLPHILYCCICMFASLCVTYLILTAPPHHPHFWAVWT